MAETLSGVNGEILRWAREFYNMNAEDAAKAIGVDVERYCNWEAGTDHPNSAQLPNLCQAMGVHYIGYDDFMEAVSNTIDQE